MRKSPDIWRRWNVSSGNGLHSLQLRIALRACELLRVGGRLVYSTCTFNPVEDEAVVAEVGRRGGLAGADGARRPTGLHLAYAEGAALSSCVRACPTAACQCASSPALPANALPSRPPLHQPPLHQPPTPHPPPARRPAGAAPHRGRL